MGAEPGGNEGVGLVGKGVQEGDGQRESLEEGGQDAAHCAPPPSSGCVQLALHHAHGSQYPTAPEDPRWRPLPPA